jgi:hypothetical protein
VAKDPAELSDVERVRFTNIVIAALRIRESLWWQHQNGVLDDRAWISCRNLLLAQFSANEIWRETWEFRKGAFDPGFVQEIDAALASSTDQQEQ